MVGFFKGIVRSISAANGDFIIQSSMSKPQYRQVVVVGAGVAGCTTTKECVEQGVSVVCFDRTVTVGGVFTRYAYPEMKFTSSTQSTQLSDFPWTKTPKHWKPTEAVEYLENYVKHFNIGDNFVLNAYVDAIERLPEPLKDHPDAKWKVGVHIKHWEKHFTQVNLGHNFDVEESKRVYYCKSVVLACGTHGKPQLPNIPGLKESPIEKIHSSEICTRKDGLKDLNVVQMGTGESGSDIAWSISKVAKHLDVSIRRYPFHSGAYFPKYYNGVPADSFDSRMVYLFPRVFANVAGSGLAARFSRSLDQHKYFDMAIKHNYLIGQEDGRPFCPHTSFGVKNFNLFKAHLDHGASIKPCISEIRGSTVVYDDGSTFDADAFVFCTGYHPRWEFMKDEKYSSLTSCARLRKWWKQFKHPDLDDIFLCGFARPNFTSFWITIELNARYIAAYEAGKLQFPSKAKMEDDIKKDVAFYEATFGYAARTIPALVDVFYYSENFAEAMGCHAPIWEAFISCDFKLFLALLTKTLNGAHYRFNGPNAKPEAARKTIIDHTWWWAPDWAQPTLKKNNATKTELSELSYWDGYHSVHLVTPVFFIIGFVLCPFVNLFGLDPKYRPIGIMKHGWKYFYIIWALLYLVMGFWALFVPPVMCVTLFFLGSVAIPVITSGWSGYRKEAARVSEIQNMFYQSRKEAHETRKSSGSYKRMMEMKKKMMM